MTTRVLTLWNWTISGGKAVRVPEDETELNDRIAKLEGCGYRLAQANGTVLVFEKADEDKELPGKA